MAIGENKSVNPVLICPTKRAAPAVQQLLGKE